MEGIDGNNACAGVVCGCNDQLPSIGTGRKDAPWLAQCLIPPSILVEPIDGYFSVCEYDEDSLLLATRCASGITGGIILLFGIIWLLYRPGIVKV